MLLGLAAQPACAVYESSLMDSSGGLTDAGAGGASGAAPVSSAGASAHAGSNTESHGGSSGAAAGGATGNQNTEGGASPGNGGSSPAAGSSYGGSAGSGSAGGAPSAGAAWGGAPSAGAPAGGSSSAGAGGGTTVVSKACSAANWTVTASESSLTTNPPSLYNPPIQAVDGNLATRWSTGAEQVGGEVFLLDLGSVAAHLTQVVLDTTKHPTDVPNKYKLELSSDGSKYTSVATGSGAVVTTISFADKSARYLRFTQTGSSASWWSIQELTIACQ